MAHHFPLEFVFAQEFLKEIRSKKKLQTDSILNETLLQMDYAERRGYVQALNDCETIFTDLQKRMLPEYN